MAVRFQNFEYSYVRDGKPIFSPSILGRKIGYDIKSQVAAAYKFENFLYHLNKNGGHVAALHVHRSREFFARLDIKNFFYSIGRNRVRRALSDIGIKRSIHYTKWSCVKNPFEDGGYVLPYGFVQSPILATLVLMNSSVGDCLRKIHESGIVNVSVYVDDISLSSNDYIILSDVFDELKNNIGDSGFVLNTAKERPPCPYIDIFKCDLQYGKVEVQEDRIDLFNSVPRPPASIQGFLDYCERVKEGNFV